MIILVALAFIVFYFVISGRTDTILDERIDRYARIVDDVFFQKDKKIEELEDRINDMQLRIVGLIIGLWSRTDRENLLELVKE